MSLTLTVTFKFYMWIFFILFRDDLNITRDEKFDAKKNLNLLISNLQNENMFFK